MKSFLKLKKYTLLVAVVFFTSAFLASCDEEGTDGPVTFEGTIAELINDDQYKQAVNGDPLKSFDSLYKYLSIYPTLVAVASGSTDITLFAPNNTAFVNLLATPGFPAKISQISPSIIQGVLAYHVVAGQKLLKADLAPTGTGAGYTTAFAQPNNCDPTAPGVAQVIKVNADGTLLTGSTNAAIDVLTADLVADNGVVHIVESVMIPPSVGSTLTPILGRLSGSVLLGTDFSYLAALITYADCGYTGSAETRLASILTGAPTSPALYTAFLPANAFFTAPVASGGAGFTSPAQAIAALGTPAQVRTLILNHVIQGSFTSTQLGADIAAGGGVASKTAVGGAVLEFRGGVVPGTSTQTIFVREKDCTRGPFVAVANIAHANGTGHAIFGYITDCPTPVTGAGN